MLRKPDNENTLARRIKAYQKPSLTKGPVLTSVTALAVAVSGGGAIPSDGVGCWIARAAFGEADIRWMIFREWLFADAPAWFRSLYLRRGEAIGARLRNHPNAQRAVRFLMRPAIERTLRK